MIESEKLIDFLHTIWGKIAVVTAALPGVASLLDVSIALENSPFKMMYPVLGTAMSSFIILILVSRPERFVRWRGTAATVAMLLGLVLFMFFLHARSLSDYKQQSTYQAGSIQFAIEMIQIGPMELGPQNRSDQKFEVRTTWDRGRGTRELIVNGQVQRSVEYSQGSIEVTLLSLFILSIALLATAFTILGIQAYVGKSQ